IGGVDHVVEIDETNLTKKSKHNRGRQFPDYWLIACFLCRTTIYSDMYATYVTERNTKRD
ncbi:hypothetical protein L917_00016, partial [Phytophthora nicotianae]